MGKPKRREERKMKVNNAREERWLCDSVPGDAIEVPFIQLPHSKLRQGVTE